MIEQTPVALAGDGVDGCGEGRSSAYLPLLDDGEGAAVELEALVRIRQGNARGQYRVRTEPSPVGEDTVPAEVRARIARIVERSRWVYGRPREMVEADIATRFAEASLSAPSAGSSLFGTQVMGNRPVPRTQRRGPPRRTTLPQFTAGPDNAPA